MEVCSMPDLKNKLKHQRNLKDFSDAIISGSLNDLPYSSRKFSGANFLDIKAVNCTAEIARLVLHALGSGNNSCAAFSHGLEIVVDILDAF